MVAHMKQAPVILGGVLFGGVLALSGCIDIMPDSGPASWQRDAGLRGQAIVAPSEQGMVPDGMRTNPSPPGAPLNATGTAMSGSTSALSAPLIDASGTTGANPLVQAPADESRSTSSPGTTIGADALAALQRTQPGDRSGATTHGTAVATSTASIPAPARINTANRSGPNLAAYALSVTNRPGQKIYNRGGIHFTSTLKACAKYVSPDQAQIAFLAAGGPQRDRLNLDPDGDGFACGWDPSAFQSARQ